MDDKKKGEDYLNAIDKTLRKGVDAFVEEFTTGSSKACQDIATLAKSVGHFERAVQVANSMRFVDPSVGGETIDQARQSLALSSFRVDHEGGDENAQKYGNLNEKVILSFRGFGNWCKLAYIQGKPFDVNEQKAEVSKVIESLVDPSTVVDAAVAEVSDEWRKNKGESLMKELQSKWLPQALQLVQELDDAAQRRL
mmetsp:Transcript_79173/g.219024  ORF Transcript_79173/g.219024 Transcript_79173/m.219024 type:complete len:196 (+) Transcript_79173:81-668(+)|eukprot:CAMPEP_0179101580 /NCGR_PEP_ID=MMETSP0796-20121207/46973_1 /TAXON_ID=73915 /ORGANISM="Pyrodinium bahamense, Strain pbaha01" /LENGTH=195 /DNA_ID=CAMNT_0020799435 /DNA_START=76 /DNA_END=663 /DNA_ORIENTATION=+